MSSFVVGSQLGDVHDGKRQQQNIKNVWVSNCFDDFLIKNQQVLLGPANVLEKYRDA